MGNQDESTNPFIVPILDFGMEKIIGWFAFLVPALLLYWLATTYRSSYLYSVYEVFSLCGICWLLFIIGLVLLIYVILLIVLSRILFFIRRPINRGSLFVRFAFFADKMRGPISTILWTFMIVLGYSLIYAYAPIKPVIMKVYSIFCFIPLIDYYQLTYLCNSYMSYAINVVMH